MEDGVSYPIHWFVPVAGLIQEDGSGHAIRYWPREERWLIDLDGLSLNRETEGSHGDVAMKPPVDDVPLRS